MKTAMEGSIDAYRDVVGQCLDFVGEIGYKIGSPVIIDSLWQAFDEDVAREEEEQLQAKVFKRLQQRNRAKMEHRLGVGRLEQELAAEREKNRKRDEEMRLLREQMALLLEQKNRSGDT